MREKFKKLSLSGKFFLVLVLLLILFSALLSLTFYLYLREKILQQSFDKLRLFYTQMEALGKYIQDDLRPVLFEILEKNGLKNDFILEAMSTTHVRKRVFNYLKSQYPEIEFERVSFHPINPENALKPFHQALIKELKGPTPLQTTLKWDKEEFLVTVKPIFVSKPCLKCHGRLKEIPAKLKNLYRIEGDFPWQEGDLMGIELARLPLKGALAEAKALSISIFTICLLAMLFLLLSLEGVFYTLMLKPLKAMQRHFKNLKEGKLPLHTPFNPAREDEFGELANSFNEFLLHLNRTQRALSENLKTLETLFESITQPIALINQHCEVEISNKAFKECPYQKCHQDLLLKVFLEKRPQKEYFETREGVFYQLLLYPVFNEKGEVIRAVVWLEDLTERKRMEEKLILTEKMAAIGQLTAGLAHEINNPLSGLILLLKQLQKNTLPEEERALYLNLMHQGLLKIQKLIQDLLNFSRKTEIHKVKTSVNHLLEETLELSSYLLEKNGITLKMELDPLLPEVLVDKDKMEQVFLNLILNAIQAMENTSQKSLTIKTALQKGRIHISFEDTGMGVPENLKNRIFDPFFTTKPPGKGTGLGLSVSLAIVESHGGKLYLARSEGGANFIIELPVTEGPDGDH